MLRFDRSATVTIRQVRSAKRMKIRIMRLLHMIIAKGNNIMDVHGKRFFSHDQGYTNMHVRK